MDTQRNRDHALAIWRAGVEAVKPARLVAENVRVAQGDLCLGDQRIHLKDVGRLIFVGGGKASAGLATAIEDQVLPQIARDFPGLPISGLVNCPEGTFEPNQDRQIELLAARPAGENVPTTLSVKGTERILHLASSCSAEDVVICLLSGGGSALLTAPIEGINLQDKQIVARKLAAAGANIEQLNTVRRALSRVKGGGLAKACSAGRLFTLVLSDVLGDDLATIASGPTLPTAPVSPEAALTVLEQLNLLDAPELEPVVSRLRELERLTAIPSDSESTPVEVCQVQHVLLGNNASAVRAATAKAEDLGYRCQSHSASRSEPDVTEVAEDLYTKIKAMAQDASQVWISGGEPTVQLPKQAGRGGRNQQLALEVMLRLSKNDWPSSHWDVCFVSGGTDGEDGPTDAAGAFFDSEIYSAAERASLSMTEFQQRADAYTFFAPLDGLLKTGPTGTNVCDLRVCLVSSTQ